MALHLTLDVTYVYSLSLLKLLRNLNLQSIHFLL